MAAAGLLCVEVMTKSLRNGAARQIEGNSWSFADCSLPGEREEATLEAAIRHPSGYLGDIDVANELVDAAWAVLSQGKPAPLKEHLTRSWQAKILNNTAGHHVYFLGLEQVGHFIVLETRAGLARFFPIVYQTLPYSELHGRAFG